MRRLLTALAAAVVLPLYACGDDNPTEPAVEVSGRYTLRTINGQDLPVTIDQAGDDRIEVTFGAMTFNPDNTFTDSTTFHVTIDAELTVEDVVAVGTYTQTGTAVTLTPTIGQTYQVSVSADMLTQTIAQFVLVYRQ
jgi:hypothetical protein